MRSLEFDIHALEDLAWLVENNKKLALKVIKLSKEIQKEPFKGIGKPEPLKNDFSGSWSRRINDEHRIIYQVFPEKIRILACRFHYED